jgi:cytochrome P450
MQKHWNNQDGDPLVPPQPTPPCFDPALGSWILSRYADVLAALREPELQQTSGERTAAGRDRRDQSQIHDEVQADLCHAKLADWRTEMAVLAHGVMNRAIIGQPINLVREVVQPWSIALTLKMSGAERVLACDRLQTTSVQAPLGPSLSSKRLAWRGKTAGAELERLFRSQALSLGKSMFFGLSQTLPHFLAKAWLALLRHPSEMVRLQAEPDLLPAAAEELLRYAGVVHTLFRQANTDVTIEQIKIGCGERVVLKIASANRDPSRFLEPDRLDVTRRPAGQLGLGTSPHACVGAVLVRMAFAVATPVFLDAFPVLQTGVPVKWTGDSTVCSPVSIPVVLRRKTTGR